MKLLPHASRHLVWLLTVMLAGFFGTAHAESANFFGIWDVNTRLTAASNAVNQGYRAGDLRVEVWQLGGTLTAPTLTTRDGTVAGQISGDQAVFAVDLPLSQILVMRLQISASLTSSRSIAGTITAEYWDTRFGYKIGLDAWSFEGIRRE